MAPLLFITGASGFIGSETVAHALEKGYRARLAIRRTEQADELRKRFADSGKAHELEFAVVPVIDDKAALTAALQGVDHVLHVASPMPSTNADLQTGYVQPAVRGTMAMLEVAATIPTIKRMIIMSAYLALAPLDISTRNGFEVKEGANASIEIDYEAIPEGAFGDVYKYHISKLLAHRAALEWVAKTKPNFDVLTVHPYYVIGYDRALKHDPATGAVQPRPIPLFYLLSLQSDAPLLSSAYVDVRDVAAMEIGAITVEKNLKPRGEITEIIALGPRISWPQMREFVKTKFPDFPLKQTNDGNFSEPLTSNTERATCDMGLVLRDPYETLSVTLVQHGPLKM
ncbi:hypothetical protein Sste5346_004859 [Sporothrix stenoceras]|uniref:NAD-dependent epimerase/dehydratase domain-containing protein n=1 Tax=Sporothrix stenoceras TaxID=5173 RepID=A0ABR3Z7D7_9PEZI